MFKGAFILFLGLLVFQKANAQSEKDTVVYYLKNSGKLVRSKDSADYFMVKMPADNSTGETLYPVLEYYTNGKRKLSGTSKTRSSDLLLEGPCMVFYPNGRRKSVMTYKDGYPVDDVLEYYPNGKLYSDQKYSPDIETVYVDKKLTVNRRLFFIECRDSTGKILAENGNGRWLQFDENFTKIVAEGIIKDGIKNGEWQGIKGDSVKYDYFYDKGEIKSGISYDKSGIAYPFKQAKVNAMYEGGINSFSTFLNKNISYPKYESEHHIGGKVFVTFFIEKDGTLTNAKILRGVSEGINNEALRVVKLSKPWNPAYENGMVVRQEITVPINFGTAP